MIIVSSMTNICWQCTFFWIYWKYNDPKSANRKRQAKESKCLVIYKHQLINPDRIYIFQREKKNGGKTGTVFSPLNVSSHIILTTWPMCTLQMKILRQRKGNVSTRFTYLEKGRDMICFQKLNLQIQWNQSLPFTASNQPLSFR